MRAARTVNRWTRAWGLTSLSIGSFYICPAQAQQDTLKYVEEQRNGAQNNAKHHHYRLVDMGTFGGPASYVNFNAVTLNNRGTVVGSSQITTPTLSTTNAFSCPFSQIFKAFEWRDGAVHELGALPGGNCSNAISLNAKDEITGNSEIATVDPLTGFNEPRAVIWQNSQIENLGTFGGSHSGAQAINGRGQVTGFALNEVPDP